MTTTVSPLAAIDQDLRIAARELHLARQQRDRSPNAATISVCARAQKHLDDLLEHRLKLQPH